MNLLELIINDSYTLYHDVVVVNLGNTLIRVRISKTQYSNYYYINDKFFCLTGKRDSFYVKIRNPIQIFVHNNGIELNDITIMNNITNDEFFQLSTLYSIPELNELKYIEDKYYIIKEIFDNGCYGSDNTRHNYISFYDFDDFKFTMNEHDTVQIIR